MLCVSNSGGKVFVRNIPIFFFMKLKIVFQIIMKKNCG